MTAVLRLAPATRAERLALSVAHTLETFVERRRSARALPRMRTTFPDPMERTILTAHRLNIRR